MSNSPMITPAYLSKICKVMREHKVRRVTLQGLQVVMEADRAEELTDSFIDRPNPMKNDPVNPPSTVDELDSLIELSKFEAMDDE